MRTRGLAVCAAAVLAVALVAGCGDDGGGSGKVDLSGKDFTDETGKAAVTVDAVDNAFEPPYVEVSPGTKVTFVNAGRSVHNVLPAEEGAFPEIPAEEFQPDDEGTVTFDDAGDYPFYCSLHGTTTKGMVGAVRVVE